MDQYLNDLSENQVAEIVAALGQERLTAYRACTGTLREALHLYQINGRLAKHNHEVMGGFEIALRNRIAASIAHHYQRDDWYGCESFTRHLSPERLENLREIRARLKTQRKQEQPGRIISGLSFHFWVSLHENKYRDTLWTPHLYRVWPKGENLKRIHADLLMARDLRNRIAHHEPIFYAGWHDRIENIWQRFHQLSPTTATWYHQRLGAKIDVLRTACRENE